MKHGHALLLLGLLVFTPAQAQEGEFEEESFGEEAFGGSPSEAATGAPTTGEIHRVEQGDTLWDLSNQYLNNPWYWPKVWSYNPQLTNPNWIYPGNRLQFYPSDEDLPTAVDVAAEGFNEEDLEIPGQIDDEDLVRTVGSIVTATQFGASAWGAFQGFMAPGDAMFSGLIDSSFAEETLLTEYDRVYLRLDEPSQPGDRLGVYHRSRKLMHPVTGQFAGYGVELVGQVEVVDEGPQLSVATIQETYKPIRRGDLVGPMPQNWSARIAPQPNRSEVTGYVIEVVVDILDLVGEHHFVYLDVGRRDGVLPGNTMAVLQRGDGYTGRVQGLPFEQVGTIMVTDVSETGATGVVVSSLRDLQPGDRIAMIAD
ncbi:MAG: LysM peptidoglycan-binding domain-containing protein [Myxococcota bacterium]